MQLGFHGWGTLHCIVPFMAVNEFTSCPQNPYDLVLRLEAHPYGGGESLQVLAV